MAVVLSLASDGGIHSAAVAINGNVVAYATEQIVESNNFPADLMNFCLERADVSAKDIDQIVCSHSELDEIAERWRSLSTLNSGKRIAQQARAVSSLLFDDSNVQLGRQLKRKNKRAILDQYEPCKLIIEHAHAQSKCSGALVYRMQDQEIGASIWRRSKNDWELAAPASASQTPFTSLYQAANFQCNTPDESIQLLRIQEQPEKNNEIYIRQSESGFAELIPQNDLNISQLFCALDQAIKADLRFAQKLLGSRDINIIFDGPNLSACLNQDQHIIHQEWVSAITLLEHVLTFKPENKADIWSEDLVELWLNDHNIRYRYCDDDRIERMLENALNHQQSIAKIGFHNTQGSAFTGELLQGPNHIDLASLLTHKRDITPSDLVDIALEHHIDILLCGNFWIELTDAKLYRIH